MRAQSETIGFVLVFSLIVLSVALVYGTGVAGLDAARSAEHVNNVGRAFEVLADNVEELRRTGAPSRSTEISLHGGSVALGDPIAVTVSAHNASNASRNVSFTVSSHPLVYERGATRIVYAAGALVRVDRGAAILHRDPPWLVDSRRAVVPLVAVYPATNSTAIGGKTTLRVVTKRRSQSVGRFSGGSAAVRVNVTVDSPRASAWGAYFERAGHIPVDANATDGSVTYGFTTEAIYVPRTGVVTELTA